MADLSITAANVDPAADAVIVTATAGATITAGQTIYIDSNSLVQLADADLSAAAAACIGVAVNGASANQPISYQTSGGLDLGATLTIGEIYVLSGTAGGVAPEADLATGDYVVILGVATAADNLKMTIIDSGVQVP